MINPISRVSGQIDSDRKVGDKRIEIEIKNKIF